MPSIRDTLPPMRVVFLTSRLPFPPEGGDRFKVFLSGYLVFRLLIEELKPVPTPWLGLSGIQVLCLGGLTWYAILLWRRLREGRSPRSV